MTVNVKLALVTSMLALLAAACAPQAARPAEPAAPGAAVADSEQRAAADLGAPPTAAIPEVAAAASAAAAAPTDLPPTAPITALPPSDPPAAALPAGPLAPDIGNEVWLNSPRLTPADLRGHPVLVEFWTFGCINCIRSAPAMLALHERYQGDGLIVIGVHTPEFDREKDVDKVRAAIAELGLPYPVAIDNESTTWRAFDNQYWPALYVIDKRGVIRRNHIGELHQGTTDWDEVTGLVEALIAEPG